MTNMAAHDWQIACPTIKERNKHMYNNWLFSDIRFSVLDSSGSLTSIPAHKYVLAISSTVFQAMFFGKLAETQDTIQLPDCTAEGLMEVFRFVYYDKIHLTSHCVMEVMYLAKKYMLPRLVDECNKFLENELEPEDMFSVLVQAKKLNDEKLQELCWQIADNETGRTLQSSQFLEVPQDILCELISKDSLIINEVDLFKAVMGWASKRTEILGKINCGKTKREVLGKAFNLIRFPLMNKKQCDEIIQENLDMFFLEEITQLSQYFNSVISPPLDFDKRRRRYHLNCHSCQRFTKYVPDGYGYARGSHVDTICVTVDKHIQLTGVRICGRIDTSYSVQLNILTKSDKQKVYETPSATTFDTDNVASNGYYGFTVAMESPICLLPNVGYIVEARIAGRNSGYGCGGCRVIERGGVVFTFADVDQSACHSNVEFGQFPELLFFR